MTKFNKARIIVSAMYNMNYVCTENDKKQWKEAKSMSQNNSVEQIANTYEQTLKILLDRGIKEKRDFIEEFVSQI